MAKYYCISDPATSLTKLRLFGELLAKTEYSFKIQGYLVKNINDKFIIN